jgi:hypothetical protein
VSLKEVFPLAWPFRLSEASASMVQMGRLLLELVEDLGIICVMLILQA